MYFKIDTINFVFDTNKVSSITSGGIPVKFTNSLIGLTLSFSYNGKTFFGNLVSYDQFIDTYLNRRMFIYDKKNNKSNPLYKGHISSTNRTGFYIINLVSKSGSVFASQIDIRNAVYTTIYEIDAQYNCNVVYEN